MSKRSVAMLEPKMETVHVEPPQVILTPDQRLRVFVSSTLHELSEERRAVQQAIQHLRLTPVMFELGARPYPPRELYRAYLEQSHVFIGMYWQRYGWVAPDMTISGLEDEYLLSGHLPRLIYVKTPAAEREARLSTLLERIRDDDAASYRSFQTLEELQELLQNDLVLLLSERFHSTQRKPAAREGDQTGPLHVPPPAPLTRLVGRQADLRDVRALLLQHEVRLVTLHGPGGIGKSRIAVELATDLQDAFPDGTVFVPLASLHDPALVLPTIAHALGLKENGVRSLQETVIQTLRSKTLLLILDNFEQVVDAAPDIAHLLTACASLKVLVTSRTLLRLTGEYEVPIPPLSLPGSGPSENAWQHSDAVHLFVERAKAVQPNFVLTAENAADIAELCRQLDGLPLAIELAAARVRFLPPGKLLQRMTSRLALLVGGGRDLPARQQTLHATVDWSFNLLTEDEKRLFTTLAVFTGGASLEAAEAVCRQPGDPDLLEHFLSLADKSLIRVRLGVDGEPRLEMLETIREYALEKLEAQGDVDDLRARHAHFFLALAEKAAPDLKGAGQRVWLNRLDSEYHNLRAALAWFACTGLAPESLRLGTALRWFLLMRGHYREGRDLLQRALAVAGTVEPKLRGEALGTLGALAWRQGDLEVAHATIHEALDVQRSAGDHAGLATSLRVLGLLLHGQGNYADARTCHEESLALLRDLRDDEGIANTLLSLGNVLHDQGDVQARAMYEESLAISRRLGDDLGAAYALDNLGLQAWYEGDLATARRYTSQVQALYETLGSRFGRANVLHRCGLIAFAEGHYDEARQYLTEALAIKQVLHEVRGVAFILYDLGRTALAQNDQLQAERYLAEGLATAHPTASKPILILLLEAFAALAFVRQDQALAVRLLATCTYAREQLGMPVAPVNRDAYEQQLRQLREALSPERFDAYWASGRALTIEQAARPISPFDVAA